MSDHYYTKIPASHSNPSKTEINLFGDVLSFESDHGVFSKGSLDKGTEILLKSLPPLSGSLLDLGCGWGPIGIILSKKHPALQVTMVDVNERAVMLSTQNARSNYVSVAVMQSDGFSVLDKNMLFDTIITNPPIRAGKKVIYQWFNQSRDYLLEGGKLYLVIRKQQGAPSALTYLESIFSNVAIIEKESGYWIFACEK